MKKREKKFYLRRVKQFKAEKGNNNIKYRTKYETNDEDMKELDFLMYAIKKMVFWNSKANLKTLA